MGINSLTTRQLVVYVAVARRLSFTAAATELHIAQSAVSVTVRDMERKLRVKLLERDTRNVVMTPAGGRLLELALTVLEAQDVATRDFQSFLDGHSGELTISALPSVAAAVLPPVVSRFAQENPDVQLHLRDRIAEEVVEDLRTGAADIGITTTSVVPHDRYETRPFADNPLVAVLPRDHPLAEGAEVTWAQLSGERFVGIRHGSVQPLVDHALLLTGVRVEPVAEASSIQSVAGMVSAGFGVSSLPAQAVPLLSFSDVVTRPLVDPVVQQELSLVWQRGRPLAPVARRLVDHLHDSVRGPGGRPATPR